ncbi:MAG: 3-oxoacyl-ACP reductase FabG [Gammaproteobacteria bacterium]|nr:3-oxoacyl-ACP reductase FabG [Gammaproteobacteria bacterium]
MTAILDGQIALVTGASRGIGKAIAIKLADDGAFVIGTATSETGASAVEKTLNSEGRNGRGFVLDVSDSESVDNFASNLKAENYAVSILVNNAGITRDNLLMRMKDEEWEDVINTNLSSVYRITRFCLRAMMKARGGRIINIASVVALSGNAGQTNYAAAKAGMLGFTRALAKEVGSRNITVNALAPGFIETDMTDALDAEQQALLLNQIALGRLGSVNEIAACVAFLASPAAAYISGETINVNGGMYMA